jgi:3-oxoadipate enol-lactonase
MPRRPIQLWWSSEGQGEPLVLLMGLGFSCSAWGGTARRLRERHRVIVVDNPGAGESARARGRLTTSNLADAVVDVLDRAGVDAAHVYGVSLGGMIAQELALRHPRRVRSLILGCTLAGGSTARRPSRRVLAALVGFPAFRQGASGQLLVSDTYRSENGATASELAEEAFAGAASLTATLRQLPAVVTHDTRRRLAQLRMPTLVLHGTGDVIVPVANARTLASLIPGAKLRLYPGAGHGYLLECEDEALRDVETFIDETRRGSRAGRAPLEPVGSAAPPLRGTAPGRAGDTRC